MVGRGSPGQPVGMSSISAQPVVCGVDESSEARAAAHLAGELAARLDVPLILAHVAQPPASAAAAPPAMGGAAVAQLTIRYLAELEERARRGARTLLDDVSRTLAVHPENEVLAGDPVAGLGRLADDRDASLLVVGAHVRGALRRAVRGAAWPRLATEDHCPVVVVPEPAVVSTTGPVVAGFDGSEQSERAVVVGAWLAAALGERLLVVSVVHDDDDPVLDAAATERLRRAASAAVDARTIVLHGEPHEQIAHVAEEEAASLIVTGSRGRGPWRSAVLGSVSSRLVEIAPRPVVIVAPST